MKKDVEFHYFIKDLELLKKSHHIIEKLWDNPVNIIHEDLNKIETDLDNVIFVIDSSLEYFQEKFISSKKQNLVIVINDIVNDFEDYPLEIYVSKSRILTSLSAVLFDLKNTTTFDGTHFSVEIFNISIGEITPCDLFLRISDEKFLKCVKKGDVFDEDTRDRFSKKSKFLWVKKDHFYLYGEFLYGHDSLEEEVSHEFSVENTTHLKLIYDMAQSCGISKKTVKTVEESMQDLKKNSKGKIKKLLSDFDKLEGTFLFSHSHFLSLLCIEIASKQEWFKHQHIDKLVMASLVHDMGYQDPENALNEALPRSKVEELPLGVREDTLNHIDAVLKILETSNTIDSDIINIITYHHGARGEESYPKKSFAPEMDLLSGIFLLCHVFTIGLFKISFNKNKIQNVLAYIDLHYSKGNFKKILPEFRKNIIELMKD
jgi:hypothetical protein